MRVANVSLAILALTATALLAGCSGSSGHPLLGGGEEALQPGYDEYIEQQHVEPDPEPPSEAEIRQMTEDTLDDLGIDGWSCYLDPTMNDDWHDDVACQKGSAFQRPYLREWDNFIEEWEILESAQEYEDYLNSGR
jgi:hypothetical protein